MRDIFESLDYWTEKHAASESSTSAVLSNEDRDLSFLSFFCHQKKKGWFVPSPGNEHIYPIPADTFESMIFRLSRLVGYC